MPISETLYTYTFFFLVNVFLFTDIQEILLILEMGNSISFFCAGVKDMAGGFKYEFFLFCTSLETYCIFTRMYI